jgi:hypothetical protein
MKYTTYEQAKWLKKKGYEIDTDEVLFCRDEINNIEEHQIKNRDVIYNGGILYMVDENEYRVYEQHQVVDWLLEKHGIWVYVDTHEYGKWCFNYKVIKPNKEYPHINVSGEFGLENYSTPQDAYSSAFNYIMEFIM